MHPSIKTLSELHNDRPTLNELLSRSKGICAVLDSEIVRRTTGCIILAESRKLRRTVSEIFAKKGYKSAGFTVGRLENVSIDSKLGVCEDQFGNLIEETSFVAEKIDPGLTTVPFVSNRPHTVQIVEEAVLHCFHRASPAYGHFVFDCLTTILFFKHEIQSGKLKVLLPSYFPGWGAEILNEVGINADHIVTTSADVAMCKDVLIPTALNTSGTYRPHPALCRPLSLLFESSQVTKIKPRKIYLSRRNQVVYSDRAITNEAEVIDYLVKKNFTVLEPANMSFEDQVIAFREADLIVSPHGSSLANIAMAKPGAVFIDLMPYDWIGLWPDKEHYAERWGLHLTTLFKLHYILLLSPSRRLSLGAGHLDALTYDISLSQMQTALRKAYTFLLIEQLKRKIGRIRQIFNSTYQVSL